MIDDSHGCACPALDGQTPGGVYLCQVSAAVSCGACCGLYNLQPCTRTNIAALLQERTLRFGTVARTVAAIDAFGRATVQREPQTRPYGHFHHCPFIGWIGGDAGRVGCLLHPSAAGNDGIDYRGLSYYGGLACRSYFCPSTHVLPARYKQLVRAAVEDWYIYGLVITETELLAALFGRIESRLGRPLQIARLNDRPRLQNKLNHLLSLKTRWPFRPRRWTTPCHYFFKERPCPKPPIDYGRLQVPPSPLDDILHELVSDFATAEQLLEESLNSVLDELSAVPRKAAP